MQYKIIAATCLALLIGGGIARAQVDFDQLLASISNDDDESSTELIPPDLSEELPAPNDKAPSDPLLPEATRESYDQLRSQLPGDATDSPDQIPPSEELRSIPELPRYEGEGYEDGDFDGSDTLGLDARNIPSPAPEAYQALEPGCEKVDLQTLTETFAPAPTGLSATGADNPHRSHSVLDSACPTSGSAPNCQPCGYRNQVTPYCLPAPILPPPATNHALYRTPACYRGLWSGYSKQRQLECSQHHSHIHGTCDCERKSRCNCAGCQAH